jgi:hypothetical protein
VPAPVEAAPAVDPNAAAPTRAVDPNAAAAPPPAVDPNATPVAPPTDPNAAPGALVAAGNATATGGTAQLPAEVTEDPKDENKPPAPMPDTLPPAPPADWKALPVDTEIIFGIQLDGPALAPWTKAKSWAMTNVLYDRYLRAVNDIEDIEVGPLETKQYNVPAPPTDGSRRRRRVSRRVVLQLDEPLSTVASSVLLRVTVHTNYLRVESEVASVVDGVTSGSLAQDMTMSGVPVSNATLTAQPIVQPYDFIEDPNASTGGSLPGWIIGCIVGAVLVILPIPAYMMYKRHKRKHVEAVEKQQAEAAAARQRMQTRIIKASGKSFSAQGGPGAASEHDILARSGSISGYGGASGYPSPFAGSGTPGGVDPRMDSMSRQGSFYGGHGRSPSLGRVPSIQQQRYQEQSLGPGAMPTPSRAPSFAGMSHQSMSIPRGAVLPVRGSDEASTSSGNLSDQYNHRRTPY